MGIFLTLAVLCTLGAAEVQLIEVHRIVAVGDIHGDVDNFAQILRLADLIDYDEKLPLDVVNNPPRWKHSVRLDNGTEVRTTLVQMGDLIDRGEQDLEALSLAMTLQEEASLSSSRDKVVLLIGNHELLNIQGHYHYVNTRNNGGFASKALRAEGMKASGAFGKYIVDNFKTAHVEEGVLFVHGGIELEMGIKDIEAVNREVQKALRRGAFRNRFLRSNGPLWTRKMIMDSMSGDCDDTRAALKELGATRVVVGHTPQDSGHVEQYCDGQVLAIDVGVSRWMYNKVAALELVFSRFKDPITDLVTTKYLIRELRKGSARFVPLSGEGVTKPAANSSDAQAAAEADEDGDL